jgi:CBS-domain-containing membrane protein
MSMRTVDDLMIRDVAMIRSDEDVHELEQKLLRDGIHGMPVVDGDGTLVGVVSQTDLIAWHYFSGVDGSAYYGADSSMPSKEEYGDLRLTDIRSAMVAEVMSPVVYCICPDQPIALAAARLIARQIHRLVVVDVAGRVLGTVSAIDLLRALPGIDEALEEADLERGFLAARDTNDAANAVSR